MDRTLDLIELLVASPRPHGINELARLLKIPVNSVYRVLMRLTERGYLVAEDGGYQLSHRLYTLGMQLGTRFTLRGTARVHLERLSTATGLTAQAHAWHHGVLLVADCVAPPGDFWLDSRLGTPRQVHCNAFGKAVLAFLSEPEREAVLAGSLAKLTNHTITTVPELRRQLTAIRETGLAWDDEEYVDGLFCIGAPVFAADGRVLAGIGISGFASATRTSEALSPSGPFARPVLECAMAISIALGHDGNCHRTWLAALPIKSSSFTPPPRKGIP